LFLYFSLDTLALHSFPTRRSSDLKVRAVRMGLDPARRQIIKAHSFRIVVHHVELGILLRQEANNFAVRTPERLAGIVHQLFPVLDRKSTRLNSSHVAISYAVFCLK